MNDKVFKIRVTERVWEDLDLGEIRDVNSSSSEEKGEEEESWFNWKFEMKTDVEEEGQSSLVSYKEENIYAHDEKHEISLGSLLSVVSSSKLRTPKDRVEFRGYALRGEADAESLRVRVSGGTS